MPEGSQLPMIAFGGRRVGEGEPVLIIAEIGVNHEGSAETCARMIEAAAGAGADAVKLQTIDADENYMRGTESHALFSGCTLSRDETLRMFESIRAKGMEPFTTSGDFATLDWVDRLKPAGHKISSGLLTNTPLIRHAARMGRPLLMSTGMAEVEEIDGAVAAAREAGAGGFALFQCTSLYPAPPETLNLATIRWLEARYGVPSGLSDHSLGPETAALAVAAGARMIEKHFTLDRARPGYDHAISLDAVGFAEMVRRVRAAEAMVGRAEKTLTPVEQESAMRNHRILVARGDIAAGGTFTRDNVGLKRPMAERRGLEPKHYETVLGRRAACALADNDPVNGEAVEGWI